MSKELTRRTFLGSFALGGAALALGGMAGCAPQSQEEAATSSGTGWGEEGDLLGCGGGERDNGVENVMIIEKRDNIGGTTTTSQGMIAGFDTAIQKKQGIELTYDEMYANLMNNASYRLDPALTKITVESCGRSIGCPIACRCPSSTTSPSTTDRCR